MTGPMLPFLYPMASGSCLRQSSVFLTRTLNMKAASQTATATCTRSNQLFSTCCRYQAPSSTSKTESLVASLSYTPSSQLNHLLSPLDTFSNSHSSEASLRDPACSTLSPSSPAAPKSQKSRSTESLPSSSTEKQSQAPTTSSSVPPSSLPSSSATLSTVKPTTKSADRGTKFRARTAALKLTPAAVERLRSLLESDQGPRLIRVGVRNKGCAGLSYHLEYIKPEEAGKFDERVRQDGVDVLIDSKALFSIIGSEMDWTEDRLSAKFTFKNPNIKEACGCGESFLT